MTKAKHVAVKILAVVLFIIGTIELRQHPQPKPKPLPYPVFTLNACNQAIASGYFKWFADKGPNGQIAILCGGPGS